MHPTVDSLDQAHLRRDAHEQALARGERASDALLSALLQKRDRATVGQLRRVEVAGDVFEDAEEFILG